MSELERVLQACPVCNGKPVSQHVQGPGFAISVVCPICAGTGAAYPGLTVRKLLDFVHAELEKDPRLQHAGVCMRVHSADGHSSIGYPVQWVGLDVEEGLQLELGAKAGGVAIARPELNEARAMNVRGPHEGPDDPDDTREGAWIADEAEGPPVPEPDQRVSYRVPFDAPRGASATPCTATHHEAERALQQLGPERRALVLVLDGSAPLNVSVAVQSFTAQQAITMCELAIARLRGGR